jgi:hypothetical protein
MLHLVVTVSIYEIGRSAIAPGTLDPTGTAVSFASDGIKLRAEASQLSDSLRQGQIHHWLNANSPLHIKLYSISFALLEPLCGSNILSAEPLNLLCYLAILVLVFDLGQEIFDRRAGLIAAATVALWPSFLLHTTQLLKDPLFLVGMLAFVLLNTRLLCGRSSWPKAFLTAASGGLIAVFIWLVRDSMGPMLIITAALAGTMLVVRCFRERHLRLENLVGMGLLLVMSVGVTQVIPKFRKPNARLVAIARAEQDSAPRPDPDSDGQISLERSQPATHNPLTRLAARVGTLRKKFVLFYPDASSNIDSNVELTTGADLVRYLPRAAMIGFFAPFPNMWFATGSQVGTTGRLISGLETIVLYVIEGFAILSFWRGRRRFSIWLLWLVAATGLISLGLVVVNVGALYRLRYVFVILLIVVATDGASQLFAWRRKLHGSELYRGEASVAQNV